MGTYLVQIWSVRGGRWKTVALYHTQAAADECFALYRAAGHTVRIV